jgi:hypothetical protein
MYAVRERFNVPAEVCAADDGEPYLSVELGEWSSVVVTADHDPRLFAVILSDETGHLQISKQQTEAQALALVLRHL